MREPAPSSASVFRPRLLVEGRVVAEEMDAAVQLFELFDTVAPRRLRNPLRFGIDLGQDMDVGIGAYGLERFAEGKPLVGA